MAAIDIHPSVKAIRTTQIGIGVSIVLVFLKAAAGYLGHSYALIADATETGADVF
ncbi:MAG: cation-efflux pump, partial [Sphingobacteriaceae bacterium]